MTELPLDRRQFLVASSALAAWFVMSPPTPAVPAVTPRGATAPRETDLAALTAAQAATFTAFAAQVIPSEPGSPGAREANVARFADRALATHLTELRSDFVSALGALDAEARRLQPAAGGFVSLTGAEQVEVMHAFDTTHHDAFETLRVPVIAGMFANPGYGGNTNKVGWKLIGFEDRFYWTAPFGHYDRPTGSHRNG